MNPYKILQLEAGADKQAVKKAYFKLIRQYTPEKNPEKFKEIREAYEYLQEEANLTNMQKAVAIPAEFIKPYYQVLEWIKEKEYPKAATLCERVLTITEILEFRILLGKAYILNDNSGKAVKLWEGVCAKNKDNAEYLEQLGDAYRARGWDNKAFDIYYRLYKRKTESLSFYDKLLDVAMERGTNEFFQEVAGRVLSYYKTMEKHTREDVQCMSDMIFIMSQCMVQEDSRWLLDKASEFLTIMTEQPIEFEVYEQTLLHVYLDLIDILEQDQKAKSVVTGYQNFLATKEKSLSRIGSPFLISAQCRLEEMELKGDSDLHDMMKEVSRFWYSKMVTDLAGSVEDSVELQMMKMEMDMNMDGFHDESHMYDTLLYMTNILNQLQPSLQRVKEKYPFLARAMGEYLDEMQYCTSQTYLLQKYENKFKKLMGYPTGARLSLSDNHDHENYDSYENGTYQRESAKIGRNDPCPCGSGLKYKKCCGKS